MTTVHLRQATQTIHVWHFRYVIILSWHWIITSILGLFSESPSVFIKFMTCAIMDDICPLPGRNSVSDYKQLKGLFCTLLSLTPKKKHILRVTDILWREPPITGEFPSSRASKSFSRHDVTMFISLFYSACQNVSTEIFIQGLNHFGILISRCHMSVYKYDFFIWLSASQDAASPWITTIHHGTHGYSNGNSNGRVSSH